MKVLGFLLLGCLLSAQSAGREIDIRIWISGGTQGLVLGNRECPGWLSVARQLEKEDPEGCWIHLGVPPLSPVPGLATPDVLIPTESDFRLGGLGSFGKVDFSLYNVTRLPQFPESEIPFTPKGSWKQEDGVEIQTYGLLSAKAPLRIPADRLRPLQVLPPLETLRSALTESPSDSSFPVVVLPEDADGADWSKFFPDIPVLILPASSAPKIIEVHNGAQLRVQPGRFGRSLIRIQLYWDTVSRTFRNPTAEIVWVNSPDLQDVDLPETILPRLHPVTSEPEGSWDQSLSQYADAWMDPSETPLKIESNLPDAKRVRFFPQDHAWGKITVPRSVWNEWKNLNAISWVEHRPDANPIEVLLTAEILAGNGDWNSKIYQDMIHHDLSVEWMPFTSRDLILLLEKPQ